MAWTERYVTNAGAGAADGTSLADAWSWATMLTTLAAGQRANVQGAISRTGSEAFTNAGTTAAPIGLRGINSTDGDLESNGRTSGGQLVTTNFPVVTYTTGGLNILANMTVEHMSFVSPRTSAVITATAANARLRRVRINNTAASSASAACLTLTGGGCLACDCDFILDTTSTTPSAVSTGGGVLLNCFVESANGAGLVSADNRTILIDCMFLNAGKGISATSSGTGAFVLISGCSFRNISGNYIDNAHTSGHLQISNCVAWGSGGSSKWYNSTTSVRGHSQFYNAIGNMGAADTNEGDWDTYGEVALSADPFTSSTNLSLNNTAGGGDSCREAGYFAYRDIGALQHQDAGGGGGVFINSRRNTLIGR